MNVSPSTAFEAVCVGFATGLTGTIGVRILDNAGATTTGRTTAGIAEYPAGSGVYYVSLTAPATEGDYSILWDNGSTTPGNVAVEDLTVANGLSTPDLLVAGGASFEAVAYGFATCLTGTLGVRITDNAGNTTAARATGCVAEYPAGSGVYAATLSAPSSNGQYTLVWDDGSNYAAESLVVGPNAAGLSLVGTSAGSLTPAANTTGALTDSAATTSGLTLTPNSAGTLTLH